MRRESVRKSVADYIKEQIFEGKVAPGERVPQSDVAAALGVSNTPVREALMALEHEGLVTIELHRGAFVNAFDAASVRDQYELFALMFGWAVRRVIERAPPEFVDDLVALGRRFKKSTEPAEIYALMTIFTERLQEYAGRDWRRLLDTLPRLVPGVAFYAEIPGAIDAAANHVEPIARAVKRGDVDDAVSSVERMMLHHGEALIRELDRRQLLEPAGT